MTDDARQSPPAATHIDDPSGDPVATRVRAICPFLLSADGAWRSATAARDHRCTAVTPPAPLAAEKQRRLCLTAGHVTCATYLAAEAVRAPSAARTARRPVPRTTPVLLDPSRIGTGLPALGRSTLWGQGWLVGLLAVAFLALLVARFATLGPSNPSPSSSAAALGSASPSPTATARATATASPTQSSPPSASPTLVPTGSTPPPSATPTPSASVSGATYTIKSGDTLGAIAARFGTTVKILEQLNGITDPRRIHPGQVLKLP